MMNSHKNGKRKYNVAIISHNRPSNISRPVYDLVRKNAIWYVGKSEDEVSNYMLNGAKHVVAAGNLVESRNRALKDAFELGRDCVMMDDDLKGIKYANTGDRISIIQAISMLQYTLYNEMRGMFYVAGIPPTANDFYYHPEKPLSFTNFLIGAFLYVRNGCDLWFDPQFRTKEDYDYTLQHIEKYGGAVRVNALLCDFQRYTNKGGVVDYRNDTVEGHSVAALKKKWGPHIRDNPKRKNEILLKI